MHLKNWSLLYPDQRTPMLSPAYDLVATVPYIADDQLNAWKELGEKDLLPMEIKNAIDKQIITVAANTQKLFK